MSFAESQANICAGNACSSQSVPQRATRWTNASSTTENVLRCVLIRMTATTAPVTTAIDWPTAPTTVQVSPVVLAAWFARSKSSLIYYPTEVYVLSDIKSAVTLFGTDVSAPIGVNVCVNLMAKQCPGQCFCPFGGDVFRGLHMWGQKRASGGPFLACQTPIYVWYGKTRIMGLPGGERTSRICVTR